MKKLRSTQKALDAQRRLRLRRKLRDKGRASLSNDEYRWLMANGGPYTDEKQDEIAPEPHATHQPEGTGEPVVEQGSAPPEPMNLPPLGMGDVPPTPGENPMVEPNTGAQASPQTERQKADKATEESTNAAYLGIANAFGLVLRRCHAVVIQGHREGILPASLTEEQMDTVLKDAVVPATYRTLQRYGPQDVSQETVDNVVVIGASAYAAGGAAYVRHVQNKREDAIKQAQKRQPEVIDVTPRPSRKAPDGPPPANPFNAVFKGGA